MIKLKSLLIERIDYHEIATQLVKDYRLRSAERGAKGMLRDAVTDWECLEQKEGYAYLKIIPKTDCEN